MQFGIDPRLLILLFIIVLALRCRRDSGLVSTARTAPLKSARDTLCYIVRWVPKLLSRI